MTVKVQGKGILIAWRACLILAFLSMLVLAGEHFYASAFDLSFDICRVSAGIGCSETIRHPLSNIALLPVAVWALAVYTVLWNIGPHTWKEQKYRLFALAGISVICTGSVLFLYVIWRDFIDLCPLCIFAHGCHFVLFFIAVLGRRHAEVSDIRTIRPLSWLIIPPLTIIAVGYFLVSVVGLAESRLRTKETLIDSDLISRALTGDFDRFYIWHDFQQVAGEKHAAHSLTIIGSLDCRHCRELLASLEHLTQEEIRDVRILFVPYPLSPACNQKYTDTGSRHSERCELAELTIQAQRQGRFWEWFQKVNGAPGSVIRALRNVPSDGRKWDPFLLKQVSQINEIPLHGIPLLLWDGQRLPQLLNTLPVRELIRYIKEIQKKNYVPPLEECDKC